MQTKVPYFLTLILLSAHCYTSEAIECAIPSESRTRVFDSIAHYQGNKLPFSVLKHDWAGSRVEFNFSTINRLPKNIFLSYDSEFIIQLNLSSKQIEEVDQGAFISLYCLHVLTLDHNSISQLSRNVFQELESLQRLDLTANKLEVVKNGTFIGLRMLKFLYLAHNKISTIESSAFANLTQLEYLNLDFNDIKKMNNEVFAPLLGLRRLTLAFNGFQSMEPDKWIGLNDLEELNLGGNALNQFDIGHNFPFVALKTLNLTSNNLTTLNAHVVHQRLPNLELLDLNGNPWYCDYLYNVTSELELLRIKVASSNGSINESVHLACSDVSTSTKAETIDKEYLERYVEKKIDDNNEKIMSSIHHLQTLIICLFVVLCVFVLFVRLSWCRFVTRRLKSSNEYLDDSDVRLLNRTL